MFVLGAGSKGWERRVERACPFVRSFSAGRGRASGRKPADGALSSSSSQKASSSHAVSK